MADELRSALPGRGVLLISLTIYVLTGGADYGGGLWDLLASGPRKFEQRQFIAHAIGPIWEADHVWLILIVAILFTGFPAAFSSIMTGLNIPHTLIAGWYRSSWSSL